MVVVVMIVMPIAFIKIMREIAIVVNGHILEDAVVIIYVYVNVGTMVLVHK